MYDRILVAVDGSPTSMCGLREAVRMARLTGGRVRLVPGLEVSSVLIEKVTQRVSELVIAQAHEWGADLIVVGSHGRHGLERAMMGSDAEQIVRLASIPVLVVRDAEGAAAPGKQSLARTE